jgi:NADPH:quinone reductase-like Zn-dependent oxidoreductase
MKTMNAVRIHSYGGAEMLTYEVAPRPVPAEGEVLIRVHATSVNPFDIAVRSGYMTSYFNYNFPLILGTDVSGVVEETGPNTNHFFRGDQVFTRAGVFRDGAYADYVLAKAADVAVKPKSLDHLQTAALPHASLTAWFALYDLANLSEGQTVLIHGAAGGVGHMAVQLAKLRGAKVIGTASKNIDLLDSLGVDQKINYTETPFEEVAHDVDVVLDTIGGETQLRSWKTLKKGGMLVSTVQAPAEETAAAHGVRQGMVYAAPPIGQSLTALAKWVDEGKVKPVVSQVLPLREAQKAHQMVQSNHTRGKLVLQVA